jgi:DNA modification methylase
MIPIEYLNQVIQGDCLNVTPNIPDNSIEMILCDLPYGTTKNSCFLRYKQEKNYTFTL